VVAPLYAAKTEMGEKFRAKTQAEGLAAAVKWRRNQFDD